MPERHLKPGASDTTTTVPDPNSAPAQGAEMVERRLQPRFPFTATAEVVEIRSRTRIVGRCSDLGLGGCYVDTINTFPVGTTVKLRLTCANRTFDVQAAVVYSQTGMGMGLAFCEAQAEQLTVLHEWVRELNGEPTTSSDAPETAAGGQPSRQSERLVLNQLISLLIRKGVLSETEGTALLRELFH